MKDELVARLDLIVSELQSLPHVVQTCKEAAQALRSQPSVEEVARVIHAEVAGNDPDGMIHHPWQKSWEVPTRPRWTQWDEAARQITALYEGKGG